MKITNLLENSAYSYEFIQHEKPILSAHEGADFFGIEIGQTAPTLILKTDKGFFALIISGNRGRVDFKKIGELLDCKDVKMANRKDVEKITGYQVGSVAMLGIGLPFILDKGLFKYDFVYGGTGDPNVTLKIEPNALMEINQVVAVFE